MDWQDITYPCTFDHSLQHAMFRAATSSEARPLLVALHTWSGDYHQKCDAYGNFCCEHNWTFMYPNFRGPNWLPEACGSDAVVQDITDAVSYAKLAARVDSERVYLIGGSGGGHASLLLAARRPELWTAVSSWCPISDVGAWHDQCMANPRQHGYAEHIEQSCGGNPAQDAAVKAECWKRSSLCYIGGASRVVLDISTGIHDGHTGSVPVSQAINAYNLLAAPDDRISEEAIAYMVSREAVPDSLRTTESDPAFGEKHRVLLRRRSNLVRLTLFEGGHDLLPHPGMLWLSRQRRHSAADWSTGPSGSDSGFELAK